MSKIKNGGLDLYGKMKSLNGISGKRIKHVNDSMYFKICFTLALKITLGVASTSIIHCVSKKTTLVLRIIISTQQNGELNQYDKV